MRVSSHLCFLPVFGFFILGCLGGGVDTGWWIEDPPDTGPPNDDGYFEPDVFFVETYAAFGGDRLDEFVLDPNDPASTLPPVMMLTFADNRYFASYNEDYTCTWFGVMNVEGIDMLEDPDLWLGFAISLDFLETDCDNLDPWVWGDYSPTPVLESTFLGIGFRPMSSSFESVIKSQVAGSGLQWERDWAPYVYTMVLGIWDEETGQLSGSELNYAFSYQMSDGALTYDVQGNPIPRTLQDGEGPPEGLLASFPYYDEEPNALR